MKSSIKDILIKSIEIENEGNKYKCNIQIIKEILNISININNNIYEGNITLNKIKNEIETFNDYNINEIFEEINILNKNNYKLIKENNNKYKLKIKFIILRRKKYLYINLYNNNKDIDKNELIKYISKLKEIIKIKDKKIKELKNKLNKQKNDINNNNIYNNFDIKLKEPIHILNNNTKSVYCLSILKDGRLVSGSFDNSIIICNKETYQPDIIIKEHNDAINCITILSSGILASCSWDNTIKLFNIKDNNYDILQTLNDHTNKVYKIIELKNKSLVSCSSDKSIIFYNKDNNNKYIQYYKLNTKGICRSVIETKDNEICYSEYKNKIYFYDLLQKKEITKINNINTNGYTLERFTMISKELLLIPGKNKISIINVNTHNLLKIINVPNSGGITSVCILNENILLTGDFNGAIRQWKIEGDSLILNSIKEKAHNGHIWSLIKIGNGYIISGSEDKSIKIW